MKVYLYFKVFVTQVKKTQFQACFKKNQLKQNLVQEQKAFLTSVCSLTAFSFILLAQSKKICITQQLL